MPQVGAQTKQRCRRRRSRHRLGAGDGAATGRGPATEQPGRSAPDLDLANMTETFGAVNHMLHAYLTLTEIQNTAEAAKAVIGPYAC